MKSSVASNYLGNFPVDPSEAVEAYRQIMELMTPDVIVVPHVMVRPSAQPQEVFRQLRLIAQEYAKRMDWGWEQAVEARGLESASGKLY